jgi:hypothetical protein
LYFYKDKRIVRFSSTKYIFISSLLTMFLLTTSCDRNEGFPDEPEITEISFGPHPETGENTLFVTFTDGDGDFGIAPNDPDFPLTIGPDSLPNPYYYNFWVEYFELREGEWVFVDRPGEENFRIPVLTPQGQNKQLEVKLEVFMGEPELPYLLAESDTIKFRVTLVDRALNESQPRDTESIFMPADG